MTFHADANAETVLGEPVTVGGATIVPVFGVSRGIVGLGPPAEAPAAADGRAPVATAGSGAMIAGAGRLTLVAVAVSSGGDVTVYPL